jgi:hypothetical protein
VETKVGDYLRAGDRLKVFDGAIKPMIKSFKAARAKSRLLIVNFHKFTLCNGLTFSKNYLQEA